MEVEAYIALGSNMGNRLENIKSAIKAVGEIENIRVIKLSKVYRDCSCRICETG